MGLVDGQYFIFVLGMAFRSRVIMDKRAKMLDGTDEYGFAGNADASIRDGIAWNLVDPKSHSGAWIHEAAAFRT